MNRTLDNATDQKTLEDIIHAHQAGSRWELPNLKIEPSWWDTQSEKFWKWIESLFPSLHVDPSGVGNTLAYFLLALKYLFYFLVGAGVLWVIYSLVRWAFRKPPTERTLAPREFKQREVLEDLLTNAEQTGNWALAARVAWKMFLREREENRSSTPYEFNRRFPASLPDLKLPYHLMFAQEQKTQVQLASWRKMLEAIESKRGEN